MPDDREALAENYRRLRAAARGIVDGATAAGIPERPLCAVEPHLIRRLRRELDGTPQPDGLALVR